MSLESIGALPTSIILSKLSAEDVASISILSRSLYDSASDDNLWLKFCLQHLDLTTSHGPHGALCASFKEAYYKWRESFSMYPWSLVMRVNRLWGQFKNWSSQAYPEVGATFMRGASEDTLNSIEAQLKVRLPLPTRVIYRFCDGQDPHYDNDASEPYYLGLMKEYESFGEQKGGTEEGKG